VGRVVGVEEETHGRRDYAHVRLNDPPVLLGAGREHADDGVLGHIFAVEIFDDGERESE